MLAEETCSFREHRVDNARLLLIATVFALENEGCQHQVVYGNHETYLYCVGLILGILSESWILDTYALGVFRFQHYRQGVATLGILGQALHWSLSNGFSLHRNACPSCTSLRGLTSR